MTICFWEMKTAFSSLFHCLLKSGELVECYKIGNLDFTFHLQRGRFLFSFAREGNVCSRLAGKASSTQRCCEALTYGATSLWNRTKDGKQDSCANRNCFSCSMCPKVFCVSLKIRGRRKGFCFLNSIVNAAGRVIYGLSA